MVITLNICKICVHSHKYYLVYKNLCKVCLITLNSRENVHMSHIFIMFFSSLGKIYIFQFLLHPMAGIFGKSHLWLPFVQHFMVICVAKWEISTISLTLGSLAIKAMALWEILIFSQQNLSFLKNVNGLCK